jgi:hypothetical protein
LSVFASVVGAQLLVIAPALSQNETDTEIFGAFAALCGSDLLEGEATRKRALTQGWMQVDESASPRLLAQRRFAQIVQGFARPNASHGHLFKRTIGERDIFVRLASTASNGTHSCHVYDFDAQDENYGALMRKWLGPEPRRVIRQPGYVSEEWYRPNSRFLWVHSRFAAGTPAGEKVGSVGAELVVTQVEKSRDKF